MCQRSMKAVLRNTQLFRQHKNLIALLCPNTISISNMKPGLLFVSFLFVSSLFVSSFRFASFRFVSFRFVPFLFVVVGSVVDVVSQIAAVVVAAVVAVVFVAAIAAVDGFTADAAEAVVVAGTAEAVAAGVAVAPGGARRCGLPCRYTV